MFMNMVPNTCDHYLKYCVINI